MEDSAPPHPRRRPSPAARSPPPMAPLLAPLLACCCGSAGPQGRFPPHLSLFRTPVVEGGWVNRRGARREPDTQSPFAPFSPPPARSPWPSNARLGLPLWRIESARGGAPFLWRARGWGASGHQGAGGCAGAARCTHPDLATGRPSRTAPKRLGPRSSAVPVECS